MIKHIVILAIGLVFILGCNKKKLFDGPNSYSDDFEAYTSFSELTTEDNIYWSYTQETKSGNLITLDTTHAHSGQQSLKFVAQPSDDGGASKASLAKQKMAFWQNETMRLEAWYYLEGTEELTWLFLMDIEEQSAIGAGPGMRLALVENALRVEYKFNEDDILQTDPIQFPRDQWVKVTWELNLSQSKKGSVKLWQNDTLIIDQGSVKTLPTDILYFQQGTKGMYSSCEIGITANSSTANTTLWVDDFSVFVVD
jgi:hypothetical protein